MVSRGRGPPESHRFMLPPVEQDRRFLEAIDRFNAGDYFDASEAFEDLFFEAVRDEVDFVRVFLQISVGIHHVERGQLHAAIERLEEAVRTVDRVTNARGYDLPRLAAEVTEIIPRIRARLGGSRGPIDWPQIWHAGHDDAL